MPRKRSKVKVRYSRIVVLATLLAFFIIMGAGVGYVVGVIRNMPEYDIKNITGELTSFVYDKDDVEVASLRAAKKRIVLSPEEIPEVMKQAIIAIEDQRFYRHFGVDPIRLGGAVIANFTKGYGSQGASTITQQLVKNAVLENFEKKMRRKIQEAFIALEIERVYEKEEILAFYLNNVNYGHGAWSLQTASDIYFGKDAKELNLAEAALLAGVVNAPSRYSPYINLEKSKARQAIVLNEMVKMNYITEEEAEKVKQEPLELAGLTPFTFAYQSFIDHIIEEAGSILNLEENDLGILYTAGYKFYTTMDTAAQKKAEEVYADDKNFPKNKGDKIVQSALVILDPHNGEIRSLIGGRQQQGERQFNRAVSATRQPGSAFKPIAVYGPALELGYGPATVLDDCLQEYQTFSGPKTFVNYDNKYRGLVSMRTGVQYSINTVAVKMLDKIGINEGFQFAKNLGITTLVDTGSHNDLGLSLALGGLTKGVSPLEMAAAYGCFANQGIYVKSHAIRKIEDSSGNVIYEHQPFEAKVMSPQTAYLMTDMMQTVVNQGTGTAARMDRPVAGKTGTTSFDVDAWFMGYTADLVGAVWLGFDQEESMTNVFGGGYGAPIWKQVMTVAHRDLPVSSFKVPSGIATIPVDYKSGLLPSNLTPPDFVVMEKFNEEYLPTEISDVWVQMPVCADTGQLLTSSCPVSVTGTFLKRPIPWTGDVPPQDVELEPPTEFCTLHRSSTVSFNLSGVPLLGREDELAGIRLNWHYPGATDNTPYIIYRSTEPNVLRSEEYQVAKLTGNISTWTDSNVEKNIRYYYVVAVQIQPEGTEITQTLPSNEISVATGTANFIDNNNAINDNVDTNENTAVPYLSGSGQVRGNRASASLSWTKPQMDTPIQYHVYRSTASNFPLTAEHRITSNPVNNNKYTDTNLSRNTSYYYRVIAVNSRTGATSPPSNQLEIFIP